MPAVQTAVVNIIAEYADVVDFASEAQQYNIINIFGRTKFWVTTGMQAVWPVPELTLPASSLIVLLPSCSTAPAQMICNLEQLMVYY